MKHLLTLLVIIIFSSGGVLAQDINIELANEYFKNGEYAKASEMYESIPKKKGQGRLIHTNYFNALLKLKDYDGAEKFLKRQIKDYDNIINYQADYAYLLELSGREQEANAAFKKLFGNSKDYYANHLNENATGKANVLVGAFMFMKRDVYNEVGGFDEDYFMYGEDIDLSYKVLKSGYNNYYFSDTTIIHFKGESTLRDKFYARRFYGAMQIFYKKHFKKNVLFDMLVWFGIRLVYMFRKTPVKKVKTIEKYVFIANQINEKLKFALQKEIILKSDLNQIQKFTEVIFDAKTLGYKTIIGMIEDNENNIPVTYKILPENSNFILGSDDAISRGEIIILE